MNNTVNKKNPFPEIAVMGADGVIRPQEETPLGRKTSPKQELEESKLAIKSHCKNGEWDEVLKLLTKLSTKHRTHEMYKALAQRVWVALKSDAVSSDVVLSLFHLLNTLGPRHDVAGPVVALAHLMAKHRTPDHHESALAKAQAQQMFGLVLDDAGVKGDRAFGIWVAHHKLDDPNHYVPIVMNCLEIMVGDDWWIDRELLQKDMDQATPKP